MMRMLRKFNFSNIMIFKFNVKMVEMMFLDTDDPDIPTRRAR